MRPGDLLKNNRNYVKKKYKKKIFKILFFLNNSKKDTFLQSK